MIIGQYLAKIWTRV